MAKTPIGGAPKFAPQRRNDPKNSKKEGYPINGQIRAKEVRLVGDNVEQGVYTLHQALQIAENQGLDLIEISPNAEPPVCRVLDYQKFLYQQKKRLKEQIRTTNRCPRLQFQVEACDGLLAGRRKSEGVCVLPWPLDFVQGTRRGVVASLCQ